MLHTQRVVATYWLLSPHPLPDRTWYVRGRFRVKERAWKIKGKHRTVESRDRELVSYSSDLTPTSPSPNMSTERCAHINISLLNLSAWQPKHPPLQWYALANRTWLLLHASDFSLLRHKGLVWIHRQPKELCHWFSDLLVRRSSQPRCQAGFSELPPVVIPSASGVANPLSYLCCPLSRRYTGWMLNGIANSTFHFYFKQKKPQTLLCMTPR